MKYFRKNREPIPFLEDWWRDDEENGGFLREHGEFGRGRQWAVTISEGKMKSFWKMPENNPQIAKHVFFAIGISHKQVVSISR